MIEPIHVLGWAFYAPSYQSIEHALANEQRTPVPPPFAIAQGRLRRFTSGATQLQLEVAGSALTDANVSANSVRSVFTSSLGELETAVALFVGLADEGAPSPARFAQSVHNTASGLFSIGTGNKHASETLAAGADTFAAGLEEAALIAAETDGPVLFTCADDAAPSVLGSRTPGLALATAFVISRSGDSPRARVRLTTPSHEEAPRAEATPAHLRGSAIFPAMRFALELGLVAGPGNPSGPRDLRVDVTNRRPVVARIEVP